MNIEDFELMRISMMLKSVEREKQISRGNLDFERFSYFENTDFRHKSAF